VANARPPEQPASSDSLHEGLRLGIFDEISLGLLIGVWGGFSLGLWLSVG